MDDAREVCRGQRVGGLRDDLERLVVPGKSPRASRCAERLAGHELHHEKELIALLAEVVDRHDVRMLQPGGDAGLARESRRGLFRIAVPGGVKRARSA